MMAVATIIVGGYTDVVTYIGFGVLAVTIIIGIVFLNSGGRVKKTDKRKLDIYFNSIFYLAK